MTAADPPCTDSDLPVLTAWRHHCNKPATLRLYICRPCSSVRYLGYCKNLCLLTLLAYFPATLKKEDTPVCQSLALASTFWCQPRWFGLSLSFGLV